MKVTNLPKPEWLLHGQFSESLATTGLFTLKGQFSDFVMFTNNKNLFLRSLVENERKDEALGSVVSNFIDIAENTNFSYVCTSLDCSHCTLYQYMTFLCSQMLQMTIWQFVIVIKLHNESKYLFSLISQIHTLIKLFNVT